MSASVFAQATLLRGTWRLEEEVITGANPSTTPGPRGQGILTDTHYCVVSAPSRQPLSPLKTPGKPTDAEKITAADHWAPVVAECGTYELKGTTLTMRPYSSMSDPAQVSTHGVKFEGSKTCWVFTKFASGRNERRQKWVRAE